MTVLITGAKGQLGREVCALLPDAIATDLDELDVRDFEAVKNFVAAQGVDTVINCSAYTAVDKAEDDAENARLANEVGPMNLAKSGAKTIIHVSTDYVFDGTCSVPYKPTDPTNPVSVYGSTKRAGEIAVMENAPLAYIVRTAWLYAKNGNNFVNTMIKLGSSREELTVVGDQFGCPTNAADLAKALVALAQKSAEDADFAAKGSKIYHFTNAGSCSWADLAAESIALSGLACRVRPITTAEWPTKTKRPAYSVLDCSDIERDLGITIPHWKESLAKCLKQ